MADIIDVAPSQVLSVEERVVSSRQKLWQRLSLGAILLLSIFMNFFQLGENGYGNMYYAAGVKSMTDSLHTFFFVSFDPGGFVTIDKPPLGFWLQAISAKIFGFTAFSLFLPQALAGVLAVLVLYHLVRRHFGIVAGLLAALALAMSPVSVVTNRNNTIDSVLALALLLGAWAVIRAAETGKLRWLLVCALCVGLGFNIKMMEAYLVIPAFGLLYLLAAPRKLWTRVWHLLIAVLVLLVISFSWAATVDLTPASQRPYVGSTQDNSEISLAIGYNGVQRLLGSFGGGRGRTTGATNASTSSSSNSASQSQGSNTSSSGSSSSTTGNAGGGSMFSQGTAGPFRLFDTELGGQIGWLLPFSLLAILAVFWRRRLSFVEDRQLQSATLWGAWLLTMYIFFSIASFFHQYYLTEMAPAVAALFGIGIVVMWQEYRGISWRGWLLPITLLLTAVAQIYILISYPTYAGWLSPLIGVLTLISVVVLVIIRLRPTLDIPHFERRYIMPVMGVAVLALLLAPAIWAGYSTINNLESQIPTAGPTASGGLAFGGGGNGARSFAFGGQNGGAPGGGFPGSGSGSTTGNGQSRTGGFPGGNGGFPGGSGGFAGGNGGFRGGNAGTRSGRTGAGGGFGESATADAKLVSYLEAHQGNTQYLVATPSSNTADALILTTNKPVMALGGFSGSDPILTTSDLQKLISNGTIRYFLLNSMGSAPGQSPSLLGDLFEEYAARAGKLGGFGNSSVTSWVTAHCSTVPTSEWQSASTTSTAGPGGNSSLYDCSTTK